MNDADRQRALRKQALLLRSATERADMLHGLGEVRRSAGVFSNGLPGLAMGKGLPLALGLLKRAPLLSPLLSLALAGARRPAIRYGALAAGAVFVAWKGWQRLADQRAEAFVATDTESQTTPDAPE